MEGHGPGRPALNITKEQIEFAFYSFFMGKYGQFLHRSVSTLQRGRRALGISDNFEQYLDISDHELDQIYKEILQLIQMSAMEDFSHQIVVGDTLLEPWGVEGCEFNAGGWATVYDG